MEEQKELTLDEAKKQIAQLQDVINAIQPPEAIYSFSTNALTRNGVSATWTVRAAVGEKCETFVKRVDYLLSIADKYGWLAPQKPTMSEPQTAPTHAQTAPANVPPPAQPQPQQASGNGSGQSFPAKTLTATVADGKTFWKIKGGMWEKWGITVYPEVLAEAGFGELNPLQTYDLTNWTAHYSLKEDGKPQKVTRLTR